MFSKRFKQLTPYTPGEQPQNRDYIKLNTNENPYPPSPMVGEYLKSVDPDILKLYPDPASQELRETIGKFYNLPSSKIFVGNGSDEVLSFCFYAFFDKENGPLLFPEHSYSFYPVYCSFYDIPFKRVSLKTNFSISVDSYYKEKNYSGIIFPNPNAPTGTYLEPKEIEQLMNNTDKNKVVIIDEAYIDFGGKSAVSLTNKFDNLLIVQTFSKGRSLAGLRVGFALGNEKLISALTTVKDSFNSYPLDALAQKAARLSIEDIDHFKDNTSKIIKTRDFTVKALKEKGWEVLPSMANFIFIRNQGVNGLDLYKKLKDEGVLVRYFGHPGIEDFIRVTIGQKKDMVTFLKNLDTIGSR
ncbi:MAG: histidinol-phosphate transaminase [Spirochaetia bacterium]|jgi:histidinol-phosphate aminotransferase|nr:histidinol-phosphate transaminase [Spirochaetia bacterium]